MALGSMAGQIRMQHGQVAEGVRSWEATPPGKEPWTYRMAFLTAVELRNCPVEGCPG